MKPFLYLDNWDRFQPRNRMEVLLDASGVEVVRVLANTGAMPDQLDFCGAFVGPSDAAAYDDVAWVNSEKMFLSKAALRGIPVLGLCFGSQILAAALLGPQAVFRRTKREAGVAPIWLTADGSADALARGLPRAMEVFHWHGDEIIAAHADMILLASSGECANQMWRWRHGPVWGIQPHPEYASEQMHEWLVNDRCRFESGGLDVDGLLGQRLDYESVGAVFENFMDFCGTK